MNKIVVLAAGKGSRMKCDLPKVLIPLKGKPIIQYLVEPILKSGVDDKPIIVVSPDNHDIIKSALKQCSCQYVLQHKLLGTGHALACAVKVIPDKVDYVVSFYGDHPFLTPETIKRIANVNSHRITMMTVRVDDFNDWRQGFYHWGRIIRNNNKIKEIIEYKDACQKVREMKEVNPGFYRFQLNWLKENINKLSNENAQGEYYLTDLIKMGANQNYEIGSMRIDARDAIGINTQEELKRAEKMLKNK